MVWLTSCTPVTPHPFHLTFILSLHATDALAALSCEHPLCLRFILRVTNEQGYQQDYRQYITNGYKCVRMVTARNVLIIDTNVVEAGAEFPSLPNETPASGARSRRKQTLLSRLDVLNELSKDGGLDSGKFQLPLWQIWRVDEFGIKNTLNSLVLRTFVSKLYTRDYERFKPLLVYS